MPANPLQELADQARKHVYVKTGIQLSEECALAVGTLLQAEREATIELALDGVNRLNLEHDGWVRPSEYENMLKELLAPEAASALAAVVQRETEKLKTLLRRCEPEVNFELYGQIRAALK